jgi:hypothetical protein
MRIVAELSVKSMFTLQQAVGVRVSLIKILLGDSRSAEQAAKELFTEGLWPHALGLSVAWRVVPHLSQRLNALSLPIDSSSKEKLLKIGLAAAAQSTLCLHRCSTLFKQLDKAGLSAVAFKGIALMGEIYSGPGERMISDIDILVRQKDFPVAYSVLRALGFTPETKRLNSRSDFLRDRSLCLVDKEQIQVDLHWSVVIGETQNVELTVDSILGRSAVVMIMGTPIHVPSPVDSIILTAHHILHHNFAPSQVVKDMCDLAMWASGQSGRRRIDEVVKQARLCGLLVPCLAIWKILYDVNPFGEAQRAVTKFAELASSEELKDAERLKKLFGLQLKERSLQAILLPLLENLRARRLSSIGALYRYVASRRSEGTDGMSRAPDRIRHGGVMLTEALQIAFEVIHSIPHMTTLYMALLRADRSCRGANRIQG